MCISNLVVYFVCTLIFGLIVNRIVTKILNSYTAESVVILGSVVEEEQGSYQQDLAAANSSQIINDGDDASETEGIKYILQQLRRGSYEEGVIAILF